MFEKIALVGIGLIGSSLARVIRREGLARHVAISTRSAATLARAKELGLGDSYTTGNIGLTYAITPVFSIDARYSDTNFPETDLYKNAKPRLAVTLKAAF